MNKYEMLYIIENEVSEEKKQAVIDKLSDIVTTSGGAVESIDKWGTRKYAYPIDYKTEGYYVLMNFESDANVPAELDRQIRINDDTVRCMILRQ